MGVTGPAIGAGTKPGYILRYDPNGNASQFSTMDEEDAYLIIGDDRVENDGGRHVVRIGGGTRRFPSTGEGVNFNPSSNDYITGTVLDVQTILGDNILCRHIAAGNANSVLTIGKSGIAQDPYSNTKRVEIDLGHTSDQSFVFLGDNGYISCTQVQTGQPGSTGPTNICNAKHNGYIGTYNFGSIIGTGLRGNTVNANLVLGGAFAATAKLYRARLSTFGSLARVPGYDDERTWNYTPSTLESPQGLIVLRGQIQIAAGTTVVKLDLDTVTLADPSSDVVVPHTFPDSRNEGLFDAMFKNPTVFVTNAGIRTLATTDTYDYSSDWTPVFASIIKGIPGANPQFPNMVNTTLKVELQTSSTQAVCVNYVIYAERNDKGYNIFGTQANPNAAPPNQAHKFVQEYANPLLTAPVTTFNAVSNDVQWKNSFGVSLEELDDGQ